MFPILDIVLADGTKIKVVEEEDGDFAVSVNDEVLYRSISAVQVLKLIQYTSTAK